MMLERSNDGDEQKNYDDLYKQRYGYGKSTISGTHDAIDFDGLDQDDDSTLYKKKHSKKSKRTAFFKDTAISPMPDPGDLEPDDDERDFDLTKKENHDKVRRDERFGKLYRDAKDKNTWYSKERSGDRAHGGEHWKRFRQVGEDLFHDVDMTGKVMNKHKSNTGIRIKLKDTIGIK